MEVLQINAEAITAIKIILFKPGYFLKGTFKIRANGESVVLGIVKFVLKANLRDFTPYGFALLY
jgi:hypothetical protein